MCLGAVAKLNHEYASACERLLVDCCKDLNAHGFRSKAIIAMGEPRQRIDEQIIAQKVDLVVMGRRKRSPLQSLLHSLGSVTSHVVHSAQVPVVVLP